MSVVIGGIYEHYKKKRYKVIGVARNSETLEKMVVYQALYGSNELWVRPYEMFCEKIIKDEMEIDRFSYIGDKLLSEYKINVEIPEKMKMDFYANNIDLEKELSKEIDNLRFEYEQLDCDSHKKDIVLTVLAAGASVSAVLLCVAKLVRVVCERPRQVKIFEKDLQGDTIREEIVLLEPHRSSKKTEVDFEVGTQSFKFKILDEDNGETTK